MRKFKPVRHKYIRFFVSSTFADMSRERDLLQQLFRKISVDYHKKEWQIEMVDLRWGISKEAGLENRTMQICKEELHRCQLLSPRPNFILLLGNRYGWIPLPENIGFNDAKSLQMNEDEKRLFDRWYRLDENVMPLGEFVLQRRLPPFDNLVKWEKEVENPLGTMFLRNERRKQRFWNFFQSRSDEDVDCLYGKSATEQEIQMGALSVADSSEHVIAYFRTLSDVPLDKQPVFYEKDKRAAKSLLQLKKKVLQNVSTENVYEEDLSFNAYLASEFDSRFVQEMDLRLRRVIDACIEQYENSVAIDENEAHLQFALEEASHFVGRESLLADVHQYIQDPNEHRPLWIKAHSGCGKSALIAKIVADHQHSHQVICRFCGLTSQTMDEEVFFKDIYYVLPHKNEMPDYSRPCYHVRDELKQFRPTQPTLLVLDALNQLETHDFGFENFTWLNIELHHNLKIIISSTDELRFAKEPPHLTVFHIPDMKEDAKQLVLDIISRNGRDLSLIQKQELNNILDTCDGSALYLRMLGYYLSSVSSWVEINKVPKDLNGLVKLIMDELSRPERHGKELLHTTLNLFVSERIGLTDDEVQALLSSDKHLVESLQENSFHELNLSDNQQLPNILWSRLRHDLSPFLRSFASVGGQMNAIFHSGLKQVLKNYLNECFIEDLRSQNTSMDDKVIRALESRFSRIRQGWELTAMEISARRLLFQYYAKMAQSGYKHALMEVIHSACVHNSPIVPDAVDFLRTHLKFVLTKYSLFPKELLKDFDELIKYSQEDDRKVLYELRNSIATLPFNTTKEQLLLYMMNQPSSSILHQLASQQMSYDNVMENILANSGFKEATIHTLSEIGELPCMSEDGKKVASLFQNRHEVRIEDIVDSWKKKTILSFKEEIHNMSCSDDMRRLLIQTGDTYAVYEVSTGKVILTCRLTVRPWASLSANGDLFACGDVRGTCVYELSPGAKAQLKASYSPMFGGRLSPSGLYLWLLHEDRTLYRFDLRGSWKPNIYVEKPTLIDGPGLHEYNVVVASFMLIVNAEKTLEYWKKAGYPAQLAVNDKGLYRVIAASYELLDDAVRCKDKLRAHIPEVYILSLCGNIEHKVVNLKELPYTTFPNLPFRKEDKQNPFIEGALTDSSTEIVGCSDHCCVCYHDGWALNVIKNGKTSSTNTKRFHKHFVIIKKDEKSIFYNMPPYSRIYNIDDKTSYEVLVSQSYFDPQYVNKDLSLALWNGRVVDLKEQMKRFVVSEGNVGGINSLSVSAQGDKAIISVGRNIGMERRLEVLRIDGQRIESWVPPFNNMDYQFIIASRVAYDGSFYLASSHKIVGMHNMEMTPNELCIYYNENHRSVCVSTGDSGCLGLDISMDCRYIAAMKGDYIADPNPVIYLINNNGVLFKKISTEFPHTTKDGIILTLNNRHLIVLDIGSYSIFDLLLGQSVEISSKQTYPYESFDMSFRQSRPFIVCLPIPELTILSSDIKNSKLFRIDLTTQQSFSMSSNMHILAASPSGRLIYMTNEKHQLFAYHYPFDGVYTPLTEQVQLVIPALDEAHIYILKDDFTILLYNVKTNSIEQSAYCGRTYNQAVCAQGLYAVNNSGNVSLFQPKSELGVNSPAVTTFVSRYNLETKEKERPSAICPMCGRKIELTKDLEYVFAEPLTGIKYEDWDNPLLFGHSCPHCSAALQFTPYII